MSVPSLHSAGLSSGWALFVRSRRIVAGTSALALIAAVAAYFGSVPVGMFGSSEDDYSSVIFFSVAPLLSSVVILGTLESRMSVWELGASRRLLCGRITFSVSLTVFAWLLLVPAALAVPGEHPARQALLSMLASTGVGMAAKALLSRMLLTISYGLVSLLSVGSNPLNPILLVGGSHSSGSLVVVGIAFVALVVLDSTRSPDYVARRIASSSLRRWRYQRRPD